MEIFVLKPFVVGKFNLFSSMENDALVHREGLKGLCNSRKVASTTSCHAGAQDLVPRSQCSGGRGPWCSG